MVVVITLPPPHSTNFSIQNTCVKYTREKETIPNK